MSLWSKYFLSITQIEGLAVKGLKCFYCPQERVALNAKTNGNGPVGIILPCTGQHTGTIVECTNHNIDDNTTSVSPWIAHGCIVGKRGSEMCSIHLILFPHFFICIYYNVQLISSHFILHRKNADVGYYKWLQILYTSRFCRKFMLQTHSMDLFADWWKSYSVQFR